MYKGPGGIRRKTKVISVAVEGVLVTGLNEAKPARKWADSLEQMHREFGAPLTKKGSAQEQAIGSRTGRRGHRGQGRPGRSHLPGR